MTNLVRVENVNIQNMADSLKARDEGMASSANHAETDAPGWQDWAFCSLSLYVQMQPVTHTFTMEQWRLHAASQGLVQPDELRAYGALTQRAIRSGLIERVGYAATASSNGSAKPLYRRA